LAELGDTKDAIVDSLLLLGFSGTPGNSTDCPLARYLNHAFPGAEFDVSGLTIFDRQTLDGPFGDAVELTPPPPIEAFIEVFDSGDVPELVRSYA
jgi:hypothetical protein